MLHSRAAALPATIAALMFGLTSALGWTAAAAAGESGLYFAADALHAFSTYDRAAFDRAVSSVVEGATGSSLSIGSSSTRRDSVTWSAAAGYRASSFFAVEASYLDLGKVAYQATGTEASPFGTSSLSTTLRVGSEGPALALIGILPLLDALDLSARAGAYEGRSRTDYSNVAAGTPFTGSESKTTTSLLLGAGIEYALSGHWAVRLEYVHLNHLPEKFLGRSFNVDLATAGLTFAF